MGNMKRLSLIVLPGAVLGFVLAAGLAPSLLATGGRVAAAEAASAIAISVDGMTPMAERYEMPVGSEQGFSVLSMAGESPAGLLRVGEAEWSLATQGGAALEAVRGEFVATVRADAPGEADLFVATSDGLSDMVTLVFTELKPAAPAEDEALSSVTVVQPPAGSILYIPGEGATAVTAVARTDAPDDTASVVFAWPDRAAPAGTFEDSNGAPYVATIPDVSGTTTFDVEAFGAGAAAPVTATGAWQVAIATDTNRDGFPDAPFGLSLSAGDAWVYSPAGPGGVNIVMVGLPSGPAGEDAGAVAEGLFPVTVRGAAGLYEIGVPRNLLNENETGILVVGEAPELTTLLGAGLAALVPSLPGEASALLSSVLLVDVLVQQDGSSTWASIAAGRLVDNPLSFTGYDISGISASTNARLYTFGAWVADGGAPNGPHVLIPAGAAWMQALGSVALDTGTFSAELMGAGLVGLFETSSLINITNINNMAIGGAQDYAIGGGTLEITVENMAGVSAGGVAVTIGGQAAPVTSVAGNVITAVVPRAADLETPVHSAAADVRVEILATGESDEVPKGFTYLGPEVVSLAPADGPATGGTQVVLEGSGFDSNGTEVSFGGAALLAGFVTPNALVGTTSASDPGMVDVEMLTANNFTGGIANAYTYAPSAAPVRSPFFSGGASLTIDAAILTASPDAGASGSPDGGPLSHEGRNVVLTGQGFTGVSALTLVFGDGAVATLAEGTDFVAEDDGRIVLRIAPARLAELRKEAGLDEALPAGSVTLIAETAAGTATIEDAFAAGAAEGELAVTGISPDGAWVIGGLVAEITGQNFGGPEAMTAAFEYAAPIAGAGDRDAFAAESVTVPLEILTGAAYPNSSTKLYVRIPALPGVTDAWPASVAVDRLLVTKDGTGEASLSKQGGEEGAPLFTYYRWRRDANGVTTTAFYYDNAPGATDRQIVLDSGASAAALSIPPLAGGFFDSGRGDSPEHVYVLARAGHDEKAFGTIDFADLPGAPIADAWVFDIHLYTDAAAAPANGILYQEIAPEFAVPADTDGTQVEPARLTIPMDATQLTAGDIRAGTVTVYGQPCSLGDLSAPYAASATSPNGESVYHSTVLESFGGMPEFFPDAAPAADEQAVEHVRARLYGFGAVTLRQGDAAPPEPVLTSARLVSGGSAQGSLEGGTEIVVFGAGLGWIKTVEFGGGDKALKLAAISGDGDNEFAVRVVSPEVSSPGAVDIRITTVAGKQAVLKNAFVYKDTTTSVVTLLLGLGVALIGLFSGGQGGGGGGPCFIATAAYGTPLDGHIEVLRTVRDTYLLDSALGTAFVDAYYSVSPQVASAVAKSPVLTALVRIALVPVIAFCRLVMAMPHFTAGAAMLAMAGVALRRMRRRVRKT